MSFLFIPFILSLVSMPAFAGDVRMHRLSVDGHTRKAWVYLPDALAHPAPLVIVLHGHGGHARRMMRITDMNTLADREGFGVAYPQGLGWGNLPPRGWNAGNCCGYPKHKQIDDVRFIERLIDFLQQTYALDVRRVYVTGVSNGAMLAYRLACEADTPVAAIAAVAGTLAVAACDAADPPALIAFHGLEDTFVPYAGGAATRGKDDKDPRIDKPVNTVITQWAARLGCTQQVEEMLTPRVTRLTHTGCRTRRNVVLYTLSDTGHSWPGGRRGWLLGDRPSRAVNATELMWQFFKQMPYAEE